MDSGDTLLDVLRETLNLTGTKKGCNVGDCGACTVLVEGEPMNACLLLSRRDGRQGRYHRRGTGEKRRADAAAEVLRPLRAASSAATAPRGWSRAPRRCWPRTPDPTDEEISSEGAGGNLCRCTGYSGILRAVRNCGKHRDCTCEEKREGSETRQRRCSVPRVDAHDKVIGRSLYTADISLPNMVHGKILGSPIASTASSRG